MEEKEMTEDEIYDSMPKAKGEIRVVYRCSACKQLYGHRFIPYGLGHGLMVNQCMCMLTHQSNLSSEKISERKP